MQLMPIFLNRETGHDLRLRLEANGRFRSIRLKVGVYWTDRQRLSHRHRVFHFRLQHTHLLIYNINEVLY
jgi:hypothetical protein